MGTLATKVAAGAVALAIGVGGLAVGPAAATDPPPDVEAAHLGSVIGPDGDRSVVWDPVDVEALPPEAASWMWRVDVAGQDPVELPLEASAAALEGIGEQDVALVTVRAVAGEVEGEPTSVESDPAASAPAVRVEGLVAAPALDPGELLVTWTPPTDASVDAVRVVWPGGDAVIEASELAQHVITDAPVGVAVRVAARPVGPDGEGWATVAPRVASGGPVGAPSGVAAVPTGESGTVLVSWDAMAEGADGPAPIDGFVITWPGGSELVEGAGIRSAAVHDLVDGREVAFQVQARNSYGPGVPSPSAAATPSGPPVGAPSDVSASATGENGAAEVTWAPISDDDDGGRSVTGYEVADGSGDVLATVGAEDRLAAIGGLEDGVEEPIQVRAVNDNGPGPWAGTVVVTNGPPTASPTGLSAVPTATSGTVAVAWDALAPASSGGLEVTAYDVRLDEATEIAVGAGSTASDVDGLTDGTPVVVQVRARNAAGPGPWSDAVTVVPGVPLAAVVDLEVVEVAEDLVGLVWSPLDPADAGATAVEDYEVIWPGGSTVVEEPAVTIDGLTPGQSFDVIVVARNAAGPGPAATIHIDLGVPTASPADVVLEAPGENGVLNVSWTAIAPEASGLAPLSGYVVRASSGQEVVVGADQTSARFEGFVDGTPVTVRVAARNELGTGPASAATEALAPHGPPPDALWIWASHTGTSGQAEVRWQVDGRDGGRPIVAYELTWGTGDDELGSRTVTGDDRTFIDGLEDGTTYWFVVAARNVDGVGPASWPSTAVPGTPPTEPVGNLAASATGTAGEVLVTWDAISTTGWGTAAPQSYAVAWDGETRFVDPAETSTLLTGLADDADHWISVVPVTSYGWGPWTPSVRGRTATAPTAAPTGLRVVPTGVDGQVRVSWNPASVLAQYGEPFRWIIAGPEGTGVTELSPHLSSVVIGGLPTDQDATLSVRARNRFGDGPAAMSASFRATGPAPKPNLLGSGRSTAESGGLPWVGLNASVERSAVASRDGVVGLVARTRGADAYGRPSVVVTLGGVDDDGIAVEEGDAYRGSVWVGTRGTARTILPMVAWFDAEGRQITTDNGAPTQELVDDWAIAEIEAVAPSGAVRAAFGVIFADAPGGERHYLDSASFGPADGGVNLLSPAAASMELGSGGWVGRYAAIDRSSTVPGRSGYQALRVVLEDQPEEDQGGVWLAPSTLPSDLVAGEQVRLVVHAQRQQGAPRAIPGIVFFDASGVPFDVHIGEGTGELGFGWDELALGATVPEGAQGVAAGVLIGGGDGDVFLIDDVSVRVGAEGLEQEVLPSALADFESDDLGWSGIDGVVGRSPDEVRNGHLAIRVGTGPNDVHGAITGRGRAGIPVREGHQYTASYWVKPGGAPSRAAAALAWYAEDGTELGLDMGEPIDEVAGDWVQVWQTAVAPEGAAYAATGVLFEADEDDEVHYADDAALCEGASPDCLGLQAPTFHPVGIVATGSEDGTSVALEWSAAAAAVGDQGVSRFLVRWGDQQLAVEDLEARSTVIEGVSVDDDPQFAMAVENAVGVGPWSPAEGLVPTAPKRAPSEVTAAPTGRSGQVRVTWRPVTVPSAPPIAYLIHWDDGVGSSATVSVPGSTSAFTLYGLADTVPVDITVAAQNQYGDGPASAPVSATPGRAPTAAPSGVRASSDGTPGRLQVSWRPLPEEQTGSGPLVAYVVSWRATEWQEAVVPADATTFDIDGLANGVAYEVRVAGRNAYGTGRRSVGIDGVPVGPPGLAPSGLVAKPTAIAGTASLSWNPYPVAGWGGTTGTLLVEWPGHVQEVPLGASGTTVVGLDPDEPVSFHVRAQNVHGVGPASADSTPITPRGVLPFPNLVSAPDDGFEAGPLGWLPTGASAVRGVEGAHSGLFSMRVSTTAAGADAGSSVATDPGRLDVEAGATYRAAAWVTRDPNRTDAGSGALARLVWVDAAGQVIGIDAGTEAEEPAGIGWVEVAVEAEAPEGAVRAVVQLSFGADRKGSTRLVDDASVVDVAVPEWNLLDAATATFEPPSQGWMTRFGSLGRTTEYGSAEGQVAMRFLAEEGAPEYGGGAFYGGPGADGASVVPGDVRTLQLRLAGPGGVGTSSSVMLVFLDASGVPVGIEQQEIEIGDGYALTSITATAPEGASWLAAGVVLNGAEVGDRLYFDDVRLVAGASADAGENLLSADASTFERAPFSWVSNGGDIARSADVARSGSAALRAGGIAGSPMTLAYTSIGTAGMPVQPDVVYTASGWIRPQDEPGVVAPLLVFFDADGQILNQPSFEEASFTPERARDWLQLSTTLVAPPTAAFAAVGFGVVDEDGSVHFIDDVALCRGTSPDCLPDQAPTFRPRADVERVGDSSDARVSWTWAPGDVDEELTGWVVRWEGGSLEVDDAEALVAEVADLPVGTLHRFTVAAVNRFGEGPPSLPTRGFRAVGVPTAAPGGLVASPTGASGEVRVSWEGVDDDGGLPVSGYRVTWTDGPAEGVQVGRDERTATVAGLPDGTPVEIEVRAVNGVGAGPAATVDVTAGIAPTAGPLDVAAAPTGGRGVIQVTWGDLPEGAQGSSAVTGWVVRVGADVQLEVGADARSTAVEGLVDGQSYGVVVAARNPFGVGVGSVEVSVVPGSPPTVAPQGLRAVPTGTPGSIRLIWSTYPQGAWNTDGSGTFEVSWEGGGASFPGGGTSTVVTGLDPEVATAFRIRAANAVGAGPWSDPSNAVRAGSRPPYPNLLTLDGGDDPAQSTTGWVGWHLDVERATDQAHTGVGSLRLVADAPPVEGLAAAATEPGTDGPLVEPGTEYRMSVWVLPSVPDAWFVPVIDWFDEEGRLISAAPGTMVQVPQPGWTEITHQAVAPAGATRGVVVAAVPQAQVGQPYWLDDASFTVAGVGIEMLDPATATLEDADTGWLGTESALSVEAGTARTGVGALRIDALDPSEEAVESPLGQGAFLGLTGASTPPAGSELTFSVWARAAGGSVEVVPRIVWDIAEDGTVSGADGAAVTLDESWTRLEVVTTIPVGISQVAIGIARTGGGEAFVIDDVAIWSDAAGASKMLVPARSRTFEVTRSQWFGFGSPVGASASESRQGWVSVRVRPGETGFGGAMLVPLGTGTVTPGAVYTASVWARTEQDGRELRVVPVWLDRQNRPMNAMGVLGALDEPGVAIGSDDWTQGATTMTAPPGARRPALVALLTPLPDQDPWSLDGAVYLDEARFCAGTSPDCLPEQAPPVPPELVTAEATGASGELHVAWSDLPAAAKASAAVDAWTVVWPGGGSQIVDGTERELAVTGLPDGVPISFRVAARNAEGSGPYSAPSVPVAAGSPPGIVTGLAAAGDGAGRVTVSWDAIDDLVEAGGASPVVAIRVSAGGRTRILAPTATEASFRGFSPAEGVDVEVRLQNDLGVAGLAASAHVVVPARTPVAVAEDLVAFSEGVADRIVLDFRAVDSGSPSPVVGYDVRDADDEGAAPWHTDASTDARAHRVRLDVPVADGDAHRYLVRAVHGDGSTGLWSEPSNEVQATDELLEAGTNLLSPFSARFGAGAVGWVSSGGPVSVVEVDGEAALRSPAPIAGIEIVSASGRDGLSIFNLTAVHGLARVRIGGQGTSTSTSGSVAVGVRWFGSHGQVLGTTMGDRTWAYGATVEVTVDATVPDGAERAALVVDAAVDGGTTVTLSKPFLGAPTEAAPNLLPAIGGSVDRIGAWIPDRATVGSVTPGFESGQALGVRVAGPGASVSTPAVTATPASYRAEVAIGATGVEGSASLSLRWLDRDGVQVSVAETGPQLVPADSWRRLRLDAVAPEEAEQVVVEVAFPDAVGGDRYAVDAASLRPSTGQGDEQLGALRDFGLDERAWAGLSALVSASPTAGRVDGIGLSVVGTGAGARARSESVAVEPGEVYTGGGWVRGEAGAHARLAWFDADGEPAGLSVAGRSVVSADAFSRVWITAVAPEDAVSASLELELGTADASVALDDAVICLGNDPTCNDRAAPSTPMVAPDAVTARRLVGGTEIDVAWEPLSDADDGGRSITGYRISWADGEVLAPASRRSYRVRSLVSDAPYQFAVQAVNAIGTGPAGTSAEVGPVASDEIELRAAVDAGVAEDGGWIGESAWVQRTEVDGDAALAVMPRGADATASSWGIAATPAAAYAPVSFSARVRAVGGTSQVQASILFVSDDGTVVYEDVVDVDTASGAGWTTLTGSTTNWWYDVRPVVSLRFLSGAGQVRLVDDVSLTSGEVELMPAGAGDLSAAPPGSWLVTNGDVASTATHVVAGDVAVAFTAASAGALVARTDPSAAAVNAGGAVVSGRARVAPALAARAGTASLVWYDADGAPIGASDPQSFAESSSDWVDVEVTAPAALDAAGASLVLSFADVAASEVHVVDDLSIEVDETAVAGEALLGRESVEAWLQEAGHVAPGIVPSSGRPALALEPIGGSVAARSAPASGGLAVEPGERYRVGARATTAGDDVRVGIQWVNDQGGSIGSPDRSGPGGTGTAMALVCAAPATAHSATIVLEGGEAPAWVTSFGLGVAADDDVDSDCDRDGLDDRLEDIYGTTPGVDDTDGDGLTDVFELAAAPLLDPTLADTDDDGVGDGAEDLDDDGLDDAAEQAAGSRPDAADTDGDGLDDAVEVEVHESDPDATDTDGDQLSDEQDVRLGMSPLLPDTDHDGTTDDREVVDRTIVVEDAAEVVVHEVAAYIDEAQAFVAPEEGSADDPVLDDDPPAPIIEALESPGRLSEVVTTASTDPLARSSATVSFSVAPATLAEASTPGVKVFRFDERESRWLLADASPTIQTSAGTVVADVVGSGIFSVIDVDKIKEIFESFTDPCPDREDGTDVAYVDLGFTLDSSGSMAWNDPNDLRKTAAKRLLSGLLSEDRAGVVDFDDWAIVRSPLTTDREQVESAIDAIDSSGGTDIGFGVQVALDVLEPPLDPVDNTKVMVLLTDGDGSYSDSITEQAQAQGVRIYTVGLGPGPNVALLQRIARDTGGEYLHVDSPTDLNAAFDDILDGINLTGPDSDKDHVSDCEEVSGVWPANLSGAPLTSNPHDPDTDDDGLTDGDELGRRVRYSHSFFGDIFGMVGPPPGSVRTALSNPRKVNSDTDWLSDAEEYQIATDALRADTDRDGVNDGKEVELGTNPGMGNTDGDALGDGAELLRSSQGFDPNSPDLGVTPQEWSAGIMLGNSKSLTANAMHEFLMTFDNAVIDNYALCFHDFFGDSPPTSVGDGLGPFGYGAAVDPGDGDPPPLPCSPETGYSELTGVSSAAPLAKLDQLIASAPTARQAGALAAIQLMAPSSSASSAFDAGRQALVQRATGSAVSTLRGAGFSQVAIDRLVTGRTDLTVLADVVRQSRRLPAGYRKQWFGTSTVPGPLAAIRHLRDDVLNASSTPKRFETVPLARIHDIAQGSRYYEVKTGTIHNWKGHQREISGDRELSARDVEWVFAASAKTNSMGPTRAVFDGLQSAGVSFAVMVPSAEAPANPTVDCGTGRRVRGDCAVALLLQNFDGFDTADGDDNPDGIVSFDDIDTAAATWTTRPGQAARYLKDSPALLRLVDTGADDRGIYGEDGDIKERDVDEFLQFNRLIAAAAFGLPQLDVAAHGGSGDDNVSDNDLKAAAAGRGGVSTAVAALAKHLRQSDAAYRAASDQEEFGQRLGASTTGMYRELTVTDLRGRIINGQALVADPSAARRWVAVLPTADAAGHNGMPITLAHSQDSVLALANSALEDAGDDLTSMQVVISHIPETRSAVRNRLITAFYDRLDGAAEEVFSRESGSEYGNLRDSRSGGVNWLAYAPWASNGVRSTIDGSFRCSSASSPIPMPAIGPTMGQRQAMANGNQWIFEDITRRFAAFIELYQDGTPTVSAVRSFFQNNFSGTSRDIQKGFAAYAAALETNDAQRRQTLMFVGNTSVAIHEQAGADQYIEDLLMFDSFATKCIKLTVGGETLRVTDTIGGVFNDGDRLNNKIVPQALLSMNPSSWDPGDLSEGRLNFTSGAPGASQIRLGEGLGTWDENVSTSEWKRTRGGGDLVDEDDVDISRSLAGSQAGDWGDYADRMWYILRLFEQTHTYNSMYATGSIISGIRSELTDVGGGGPSNAEPVGIDSSLMNQISTANWAGR